MQLPELELKPMKRISPSTVSRLQSCQLRVVLGATIKRPLLPYMPVNHLGNVIHKMLELNYAGVIEDDMAFEKQWRSLIVAEEKKLIDRGFHKFIPISENVDGYAMKKLQTKSMLRKSPKAEPSDTRSVSWKVESERWLQSKDSNIGGVADLILDNGQTAIIADFKTGKVRDRDDEIKAEYKDQLKLYAFLFAETCGRFPDRLILIDMDKQEHEIQFTNQECISLAEHARQLLNEVNAKIEHQEIEGLATPGAQHCSNCLQRPACTAHWSLSSMAESPFCDLRGKIISVNQFQNGNINVNFACGSDICTLEAVDCEMKSWLLSRKEKEVAFYNVKRKKTPLRYQALKTTCIYDLP